MKAAGPRESVSIPAISWGPVLNFSDERRAFGLALEAADERQDLAAALLRLAAFEYEALDVDRYLGRLDALADGFAGRGPGAAAALARHLFGEGGFRGNASNYYDPRNSFLNEVLDRRVGIPISLSALYLEVARRCGIAAAGISFPGHFLVRAEDDGGAPCVLDPFHGGARLSLADCRARLLRVRGREAEFDERMLEPCSPRELMLRVLRNLKVIYARAGDARRALRCADLGLVVAPDNLEDLRDRGRFFAELDCYALAADDLELYLVRVPAAPDATDVQAQVSALRARAARLN
jgi:regulator of sirC expression with transglutaminase-like and TPR domain